MNEKIELKLIIDGKEAITTLNLTDENLKKLVTGFDRVRGASTRSSLDIAAAWGSVTIGINQAMQIAERFYGVISAPIKVAGQFEAYEAQLKVMLGSAEGAKQRLAELQEFAATTPFTLPQVVEAGNQLQAMNRYSIETIRQLGDLAAASGKPFDQVMNAYAKLVSGQKGIAIDMFRDLLITSKDWAKATSAHFSKNGEISASAEEMAAALPKILKEKGFDGMMAEQAKIMNGMASNFEDAVTKLFNVVGSKLLPQAKNTIQSLTKSVNELSEAIEGVSEKNTHVIEDEAIMNAQKARVEFDLLTNQYLALSKSTHQTSLEKEKLKNVINELNAKYPDLTKYVDLNRASYENVVTAFAIYKENLIETLDIEVKVGQVRDRLRQKNDNELKISNKIIQNENLNNALKGEETLLVYDKQSKKMQVIKKKMDYVLADREAAKNMLESNRGDIIELTGANIKLDGEINKIIEDKRVLNSLSKFGKKTDSDNKGGTATLKKTDHSIEIFDAQKLSEFENKLHAEKIKAIQQSEETALAIIRSHNDQEFALRRNHAKATITDKQQLEAALVAIDKEELERKKQLLTDQLSIIKADTTLEKDERELKEQELLTAITTVEGQILDVKREASNKAIGLAEREAEFRKQTMKQIIGDTGSLFGQMYSREQESTRREIDAEKKKRTESIETERRKRLEHAVTQQEKDRINREYDTRLKQMEEQYEQRQKEAGVEMFYMQQHIAAVQALINTYEAATKAYAQGGALFGPPLAAMITALGLAQVAMIESQEPPGYIRGGLVEGSAGVDSNVIRVTNGEYVINPDATNRYINVLDAINNNRELKIPVSADRDSELTTEIRLLRQENRRLLSQQLKAFSRTHKIKAGIDRYETAAIVETAETLINRSKA